MMKMFRLFKGEEKKAREHYSVAMTARATLMDLIGRPSVLYCFIAGLLILWGKYMWASAEANSLNLRPWELVGLPLSDLMLLSGLAAGFVVAENLWSPAKYITGVVCFAVALVALFNVAWLRGTGDQLGRSVLEMIWDSPVDSIRVALDEAKVYHLITFSLAFITPVLLPVVIWWRSRHARRPQWSSLSVPLAILLIAGFGKLLIPRSDLPVIRANARNVHVSLVLAMFKSSVKPKKDKDKVVIDRPEVYTSRVNDNASLRNVIIIVIESGSYARSSLGDPDADRTPFVAELAEKGLNADNMRAVLPHTTKSLFSIFCGAHPSMERKTLENADNYPSECLPRVLRDIGYTTAFFQSANGEFEGRPRLASNMGFDEFYDRLVLDIEETVHLSGDDMGLVDPVVDWIKAQERPFMTGILTSLTHTPYGIPYRLRHNTCKTDWTKCRRWRYELLYPEADRMVRGIIEKLEGSGILEETVVVIMGDHGESLGEHRKWTHDNVYYDDGLKVPYVVWAPGLINENTVVNEPRSLLDTYPTVLSLLGVPYNDKSMPGISLLDKQPPDTKRYFTCFYDDYCYGYVKGDKKVVYVPKDETTFLFDLAEDPKENKPQLNSPLLADDVKALQGWIEQRRGIITKRKYAKKQLFDRWKCNDTRHGGCKYISASTLPVNAAEGDHGLSATYYTRRNFQGKKIRRVSSMVDYQWGFGSPLRGVPKENFSARWAGCVLVKEGESPYLAVASNDGMLLYLNNELFIDNGGVHFFKLQTAPRPLEPGIHPILLEYTEETNAARAFLGWSPGGTEELSRPTAIPSERLIPLGGNSEYACPATPMEPAFGLTATYYSTKDFKGSFHERLDGSIDFNWGRGSPMKGLPKDKFSVRWEGCIVVQEGEKPALLGGADDGMRVYLNDELIIDNGGKHKYKEVRAKQRLKPGVYKLKVEYSEANKDARAFLGWVPWGGRIPRYISKGRLIPRGGNSQYSCPAK